MEKLRSKLHHKTQAKIRSSQPHLRTGQPLIKTEIRAKAVVRSHTWSKDL
jgi:hypothetical protein